MTKKFARSIRRERLLSVEYKEKKVYKKILKINNVMSISLLVMIKKVSLGWSWLTTTKNGDGALAASEMVINSSNFRGSYLIIRRINAATLLVFNLYSKYFLLCLKVYFLCKKCET